jgi:putative FmdB family regulatory protein
MPLYDYVCDSCGNKEELFRSMEHYKDRVICDRCRKHMRLEISVPNIRPDLNDFSNENSGRGRFNKQLMCHVKSVNDAVSIAKSRGMYVLDS